MPPKLPAESMEPEKNAQVLRQVRQMHVGQLGACVSSRAPLERAADDVEVLIRLVAHHAVAFEQSLHEPLDHLRVLPGEAAVHDQHVGDDQQVAVRREHVRLAAAASTTSDTFGSQVTQPARRFLPDLRSCGKEIAGGEAVLGVDEVQPIGMRRARRGCPAC